MVLLAFWFALSWRASALFVVFGVTSAVLVTAATHRALASVLGPVVGGLVGAPARAVRFVGYVAWLLTRIPPSAWDVARHSLRRTPTCDPRVVVLRTRLASPVARALLANSISVVPGTITLDVEGDRFTVHAFTPSAADDLVTAELQNRIGRVFGQPPEPPPDVAWDPPRAADPPLGGI